MGGPGSAPGPGPGQAQKYDGRVNGLPSKSIPSIEGYEVLVVKYATTEEKEKKKASGSRSRETKKKDDMPDQRPLLLN